MLASGLTLSHLQYVCLAFSAWQELTTYITKDTVLQIGKVKDQCPCAPGPSHPPRWGTALVASPMPAARLVWKTAVEDTAGGHKAEVLAVSIRRDFHLFLQGFWNSPPIPPPPNRPGTVLCHAL